MSGFYPVKVMSPTGKVKKVITPKQLSKRYWKMHEEATSKYLSNATGGSDYVDWASVKEPIQNPQIDSHDKYGVLPRPKRVYRKDTA